MRNNRGWICFLGALVAFSGALFGQGAGQPRILKESGDGQLVQYMWSFTQPLVVRVVDGSGQPIPGKQVTWSDLGGISYASEKVTATDANGFAFLQWLPGGNFGLGVPYLSYTITATADVGSASFSAVSYPFQTGAFNPQPSVQILKPPQGSGAIEGRVGDRLVDAIRVAVVTTGGPGVSPGLPIPGVGLTVTSVNQNPAQGPVAACEGGTILTSADGIVSCDLLIQGAVGNTQLTLNVGDMVTHTAQLSVAPGVSSSVVVVQGNNQSGVPGQTLAAPLVARVVNPSGLPLPGTPVTWSVLPPGAVTLANTVNTSDSAGLVSANVQLGQTPGTYQVRVSAGVGQAAFNVTVQGASAGQLAITTATLPNGAEGVNYNRQLEASGGTPPYQWTLTGGALPQGLTLSPAGVVSGTPAAAGPSNFTVQVADGTGAVAARQLSLAIGSGVTITTTSLPMAAPGVQYTHQLMATGGTPPYEWRHNPNAGTIAIRPLPPGLNLSPAGVLSGTPTTAGDFTFTVEARDAGGVLASQTLTLVVGVGGGGGGGTGPAPSIVTASLPSPAAQAPYAQTLSASGGTPPYSWNVAGGTLPPGVTLTQSGVLSGVPGTPGSYGFTVQVVDAGGMAATRNFTLEVVAVTSLTITTAALPNGVQHIGYLQVFGAIGGQQPYTWSLTAGGTLPSGLTLTPSGLLSGTPAEASNTSFTLEVQDAAGTKAQRQFTLAIGAGITVTTPAALPPGALGVSYEVALAASGGSGTYGWEVFSGTPPQGLSLSPEGVISGMPAATGVGAFVARVMDTGGLFRFVTFSIEVTSDVALPRAGTVSQLAVGGGWNTGLSLINPGPAETQVQVRFVGQDGEPLTLPVTVTQGGSAVTQPLSEVDATLPSNGSVLIETMASDSATVVGWADVRSATPVSGYAIFRQESANGRVSEGTSPVDARARQEVLVPFDNSGGFVTGIAVVNLSASEATVTVIQRDGDGAEIASDTWQLVPRGHTSFAVPDLYPALSGRRGVLEVKSDQSEGVMALGLRFSPAETFTSIPVLVRP